MSSLEKEENLSFFGQKITRRKIHRSTHVVICRRQLEIDSAKERNIDLAHD